MKYFLIPAIVLAIAAGAAQHPDETVAHRGKRHQSGARPPDGHLRGDSRRLAVALSPYILVAALVGLLVSGVQLLPDALKPVLPAPVREVEARVEQLQRAVTPGVEQAKALRKEANARAANLKTEVELAKARADAERVKRREAERVEAERRAAEAEERRARENRRTRSARRRRAGIRRGRGEGDCGDCGGGQRGREVDHEVFVETDGGGEVGVRRRTESREREPPRRELSRRGKRRRRG